MKTSLYEKLNYADYIFPVIYHIDTLKNPVDKDTFQMHWHDSIEILYFIEGNASVKCDYTDYDVAAGDVFIINANQLHSIRAVTDKCVYHCFILSENLFDANYDLYQYSFANIIRQDEELNRMLYSIVKEIKQKDREYKMAAKGYIYQAFSHLARRYSTPAEGNESKLKTIDIVKSSLLFMEQNYDRQLTLEDICSQSNLSKYYFCRVFKETLGKSPVQYLNYMRVAKAAELLKNGECNVFQAAESCGFNNYNYFSKVFKKYLNVLPKDIKKKAK